MLKQLVFSAGASPAAGSLELTLTPVTVFVGPNNSGKSLALREIEAWCTGGNAVTSNVIQKVVFEPWSPRALDDFLHKHKYKVEGDTYFIRRSTPQGYQATSVHRPGLLHEIAEENLGARRHMRSVLGMLVTRLDGQSRLALVNEVASGDLQEDPTNPHGVLFRDGALRSRVRAIIHRAFGRYLVVDPTNTGSLRYRFSARPPSDEAEEQNWDSRARDFHAAATPVASSDSSDGLKAYTGIITALLGGEPKVTLIDEPEAFLHPSLSHQLGKDICSNLAKPDQRVIVATHSPNFLMGCVAAAAPMNIVRLTFANGVASTRVLDRAKLQPMLRNPLLRSIGVLGALFHNAVVVTESDADRAFYQEINERLLSEGDSRGIENCLFLNAQNKQTVWSIVQPLREIGIPAAGVVDIDVIKEGGTVWQKPMAGAFVPEAMRAGLEQTRSKLFAQFQSLPNYHDKLMKRHGGVQCLGSATAGGATDFFEQLARYGIFVVVNGELESWLPELDVSRSKDVFLHQIFEKMGDDPASDSYVRPGVGDVWDFMGGMNTWLRDASRRGMPVLEA